MTIRIKKKMLNYEIAIWVYPQNDKACDKTTKNASIISDLYRKIWNLQSLIFFQLFIIAKQRQENKIYTTSYYIY